jgi:hypothetical protein
MAAAGADSNEENSWCREGKGVAAGGIGSEWRHGKKDKSAKLALTLTASVLLAGNSIPQARKIDSRTPRPMD